MSEIKKPLDERILDLLEALVGGTDPVPSAQDIVGALNSDRDYESEVTLAQVQQLLKQLVESNCLKREGEEGDVMATYTFLGRPPSSPTTDASSVQGDLMSDLTGSSPALGVSGDSRTVSPGPPECGATSRPQGPPDSSEKQGLVDDIVAIQGEWGFPRRQRKPQGVLWTMSISQLRKWKSEAEHLLEENSSRLRKDQNVRMQEAVAKALDPHMKQVLQLIQSLRTPVVLPVAAANNDDTDTNIRFSEEGTSGTEMSWGKATALVAGFIIIVSVVAQLL